MLGKAVAPTVLGGETWGCQTKLLLELEEGRCRQKSRSEPATLGRGEQTMANFAPSGGKDVQLSLGEASKNLMKVGRGNWHRPVFKGR